MIYYNSLRPIRKVNYFGQFILRHNSQQQLVVSTKKRQSLSLERKPCRPPFMKNVFLGIFDKEMLTYPELDKAGLQDMKKIVEPYKESINQNVDPKEISSLGLIPSLASESLKSLGLYGQLIPSIYGGSDQTATETALISEMTAKDLNVALTLYSHNFLGAQTIIMYGNTEQKAKYLPLLASGEKIAAFCMSESESSSDIANCETVLSKDCGNYVLNGKKMWVTNASNAGLFIVTAKHDVISHTGTAIPFVRIVLIDRDSPGITISRPVDHLGLSASNICEVSFENTPVPLDCLIEGETEGFNQCAKIINSGRYNIGAITVGILKSLLKDVTDFINSRKQFHILLRQSELIHKKCADIAKCIYTLESMIYHTTLMLDTYENPDCALELAIIKVFSFTEGRKCMDLLIGLMGGRAFMNSEISQKYFKDFRTMEMFDGTVDIANLFISLLGLQHAGTIMNETVSKVRFPYQYPEVIFKQIMKFRKHVSDNPKLNLNLYEQLHPSLTESSNELEYCVLRLHYAVVTFMNRYGSDIVNQQLELMRLADAAVKIYAMTCVLGRASRSYCIGLRHAEDEIKYAHDICFNYKKTVQIELNDLIDGFIVSGDILPHKQGADVLKKHGYYLEHPLARSF